ncbi:MAG TPA: class I SAM-dependent methyltransferase [Azospirillaceae bacterium]|nr:class I SAM-dependent methyltransferase [Azospirillaceae bacterium]
MLLAAADVEDETGVRFGALVCSNAACQLEFPIIDGAPILVTDVRAWLAGNFAAVNARDDLPDRALSQLGDCVGADSAHNAFRQHQSSYAWDHWGAFDDDSGGANASPGGVARLLRAGLELLGPSPLVEGPALDAPVLDVGTACGRAAFDLAASTGRLTLGVDLNWPLLKIARQALERRAVSYPRRRIGVVFDQRRFSVAVPCAELVDFWVADALALPFADQRFGLISALNLLDCVGSPVGLLQTLDRLTAAGGAAVLATPFDWSPAATPMEAWIGGHSQRGPDLGAADALLRRLLTPGAHPQSLTRLRLAAESQQEWRVRLHERAVMTYVSALFGLKTQ